MNPENNNVVKKEAMRSVTASETPETETKHENGLISKTTIKPGNGKGQIKYVPVPCGFRALEGDERKSVTTAIVKQFAKGQNLSPEQMAQMASGWDNCQLIINTRSNGEHTVILLGHYAFTNFEGKVTYGFNYVMLEMNADMTDFIESAFVNDLGQGQ